MAIPFQVTFDCADPDKLAGFWAAALGYKKQDPPQGYNSWEDWLKAHNIPQEMWNSASAIVDPEGKQPRIFFQQVPEGKIAKNRLHFDVNVSAGKPPEERRQTVLAEVERFVSLGAEQVGPMEQRGEFWVVMRDPEGNEFCLQ
jgi:hypothetical protein